MSLSVLTYALRPRGQQGETSQDAQASDDGEVNLQPHVRQDLLVLHQKVGHEFDVIKRLQWSSVYYAIVAKPAIVGAASLEHPLPPLVSMVAVILVGASVLWFLRYCHDDLNRNRDIIDRLFPLLSERSMMQSVATLASVTVSERVRWRGCCTG